MASGHEGPREGQPADATGRSFQQPLSPSTMKAMVRRRSGVDSVTPSGGVPSSARTMAAYSAALDKVFC